MSSALNKSCGWIVAFWLLLALFSEHWWVAALSIGGAMATVIMWTALVRRLAGTLDHD